MRIIAFLQGEGMNFTLHRVRPESTHHVNVVVSHPFPSLAPTGAVLCEGSQPGGGGSHQVGALYFFLFLYCLFSCLFLQKPRELVWGWTGVDEVPDFATEC